MISLYLVFQVIFAQENPADMNYMYEYYFVELLRINDRPILDRRMFLLKRKNIIKGAKNSLNKLELI